MKPDKISIISTNTRYPEDLYKELAKRAKEENRSINNLVVTVLQNYLKK